MRLLPSIAAIASVSTALLAPVACGNSLKSTYIPADRFGAAYAQALCTSLKHCCDENQVTYDYNACTAGWKSQIQKIFGDPNLAASINYDPKAATSCVQLVQAAEGVSCAPVTGSISDARATCQTIFSGKKPPGADCTIDAECAPVDGSTVRCIPAVGEDAGGQLPLARPGLGLENAMPQVGPLAIPLGTPVCVAIPIAQTGAPCAIPDGGSGAGCNGDPTTFCDPASFTCVPRADVGGPCSPNLVDSCLPGAYCVRGQGLCAQALPPGSPCTTSVECDVTTTCDVSGTKTCTPRKQPNSSCSVDAECSVNLCDVVAKKCLRNTIATTNACTGVGP
jgi:hypothetical protein